MVIICECYWVMCIDGLSDSGTTLDAQTRYAEGTKEIIRRYFAGEEQDPVNLIVTNGDVSFAVLLMYDM